MNDADSNEDPDHPAACGAGASTASPQLERIARILDCPLEVFSAAGGGNDDAAQTVELVRLWQRLREPELRRAFLDQLRESVARQPPG